MNCDRALVLMVDAAEGTIPPGDRRGLETHAEGCASCAAAMRELSDAVPAVHAALRQECDAPAPGFDDRVRASVTAAGRRSPYRWIPRLAFAAALAALIAMTVSVYVADLRQDREADAPIEAALSVFPSPSIYEPETREEVADAVQGLFTEAFSKKEMEAIDAALGGDVEDQIEEMDDASLQTFEEMLRTADGAKKSG